MLLLVIAPRRYDTRSDEALMQIAQIVREDTLWNLVDSAIRGAGTQSTWARAVGQNLQYVLMGHSAAKGIDALKSDLVEIIQMHSYVARGGRSDLLLPTVTLEASPALESWADLAAEALALLLSSRSSEVVGSAFIGIQALVALQPSMISKFFGLSVGDAWKRKWILNAAELWSTLYPNELERSRTWLETILTNGSLRDRIQSWIVLSHLAFQRHQLPPAFPNPPAREKLYLLATRHRVPDDEVVIAARVNLFTWSDDIVFRLWSQKDSDSAQVVSTSHCPRTLSGRTFVFKFDNWWEPSRSPHPTVFAVGGHQRLLFSFPEFLPSRIWVTQFGWDPSSSDPLRWSRAGTPVARHERLHGAPRSPNSGQPRQPMVDRWLVKRDTWNRISEEQGPFVMKDDFQMYASDVES
jgi:hypothetical protein